MNKLVLMTSLILLGNLSGVEMDWNNFPDMSGYTPGARPTPDILAEESLSERYDDPRHIPNWNPAFEADRLYMGRPYPPHAANPTITIPGWGQPVNPAINVTDLIPVIETKIEGFTKVPDVAQYGHADWSGVVGIVHDTTLQEAAEIARENPEITFFFYMTGDRMVLNTGEDGTEYREFKRGDAVFFSGEPWWGSAKGFSNGYIKENQ